MRLVDDLRQPGNRTPLQLVFKTPIDRTWTPSS
jgi:hypothetical protein